MDYRTNGNSKNREYVLSLVSEHPNPFLPVLPEPASGSGMVAPKELPHCCNDVNVFPIPRKHSRGFYTVSDMTHENTGSRY